MKILWICNIMLPIIAHELGVGGSNKEGWLSGLCDVIMERQQENGIELHVAYPGNHELDGSFHKIETGQGTLKAYGFYEDIAHAECYDVSLEERLKKIIDKVNPDVIHCFGTEFAHTLAVARCCETPERLLVGIQGVCSEIAKAYMADLPEEIQSMVTFRDWLKKDSMKEQQLKFAMRGEREVEILSRAGNITGRTGFDRDYASKCNKNARYFTMNETLRGCFYEGQWNYAECEPHTIFLSQGDYPLKGLHYLLLAAGKLKEKYPDLKIKIAGNSLVNYRTLKDKIKISAYGKYLRKLLKENGLEDRVHFLGRLTAEEMKAEYLKCGLYVCCSSNENSPNSLGEAMLLGVPCVAAKVGGIPSLFADGQDGILYQGYEKIANCQSDARNNIAAEHGDACNGGENNECYLKEPKNNNGCTVEKGTAGNAEKTLENNGLERVSDNLASAIFEMWSDLKNMQCYCKNAREHARKTHDREQNYVKMTEIYSEIAGQRNA